MGRNELYNHNQIYLHRSCNTTCLTPITFLPLLCRLSTKVAVKISEPKNDPPSSPKVGCMGQIKRHNNNKINNTTTTTGKLKYTQLKKMFSGRNLVVTTTTNSTNTNTNTAFCKVGNNNKKIDTSVHGRPKFHNHGNCAVVVPLNLAELDPPLPVVPCGLGKGGQKGSLWKRRGGVAPIQPIQLPYNNTALLPPSSVL